MSSIAPDEFGGQHQKGDAVLENLVNIEKLCNLPKDTQIRNVWTGIQALIFRT